MKNNPGLKTGLFGKWLSEYIDGKPKPRQYCVYYDHGDVLTASNVAAIKGFYGDFISNQNQLAEVDVMVANLNHEIMMIVEIEERKCPPKKIIGDIAAILMCNRFSVRLNNENRYFRITPETRLIIAGIINPAGSKKAQLENVILPRFQEFAPLKDGIDPKNLSLIFEGDLKKTIEKLEEYVHSLFL